MDASNPYEQLGITESSPFEEVTAVRNRLLKQAADDQIELERIEAAYDAILRDRLRARIEGKITVPDRIRFAEKSVSDVVGKPPATTPLSAPSWLSRTLDRPDRKTALISVAVFGGLGILGYLSPQGVSIFLAIGLLVSFYLIYWKEKKFGRTLLLMALALTLGTIMGYLLHRNFGGEIILNLMGAILFWLLLVTNFLR